MLLATFVIEREPTRWADLGPVFLLWLQNAGLIASLALFIVFCWRGRGRFDAMFRGPGGPSPRSRVRFAATLTLLSWLGYLVIGVCYLGHLRGIRAATNLVPGTNPDGRSLGDLLFAGAGACALFVVAFPMLRAILFDMRLGRIWALARLSLKEALHGWAFAIFGAIALVFLFAEWFIPYKAEDQVRNYVRVLYWTMTPLYILCAAILGSFGLPNDIKNQTIHTIVTKPITKFEIVLGRFLGHAVLLTVGLFGVAFLSLGYIFRGVNDEARKESLTARVATYGRLEFAGTQDKSKGQSVGREWSYRSYVGGQLPGSQAPRQYAIWTFDDLSNLGPRQGDLIRVEFTFDIFRLTKGVENRGVNCTFLFTGGGIPAPAAERLATQVNEQVEAKVTELARKDPGTDRLAATEAMWKELGPPRGVHQKTGVEVSDYQTQAVEIPYALIQSLRDHHAKLPTAERARTPVMQILVAIDRDRGSAPQMLGVARFDLYLLAAEREFWINFLKGIIGIWCSVILVLGVSVALSTYLSGVISLITTLFLFLAGLYVPDIVELTEARNVGGGPIESMVRISTRTPIAMPLDDSASSALVKGVDVLFRLWIRIYLYMLPDVERYDRQAYVANGFDISWSDMIVMDNLLALFAYLIPWALLAYYLIEFREIANPT